MPVCGAHFCKITYSYSSVRGLWTRLYAQHILLFERTLITVSYVLHSLERTLSTEMRCVKFIQADSNTQILQFSGVYVYDDEQYILLFTHHNTDHRGRVFNSCPIYVNIRTEVNTHSALQHKPLRRPWIRSVPSLMAPQQSVQWSAIFSFQFSFFIILWIFFYAWISGDDDR